MQKLLSIQALDEHDIEGVYPLYQHVLQQLKITSMTAAMPIPVAAELDHENALQPCGTYVQELLDLGWSEQMKILQNYLLATTAKDCSLMIALQALPQAYLQHMMKARDTQLPNSAWGIVRTATLASPLRVKLTGVDLDRKHHAKIAAHHRLDQELMFHVNQNL